jgi:hypothetical protein
MKLKRRDFLAFAIGGTLGGAVATATGLTYYYQRVKPWHIFARAQRQAAPANWILNEEDLEAFARADALVESNQMEMLDNTDIPGSGDFRATRVRNLGECVTACASEDRCKAFTYARSTHALPEKRQMCWLKEDDPERIVSGLSTYVSGTK